MTKTELENSQLGHHTKEFDSFEEMMKSLNSDLKIEGFVFEGRSFYEGKHKYHYSFK